MSEFGVSNDAQVRRAERAIDDRPLSSRMTRAEHVLQTRALKSVLRRGTALPGGAQVITTAGEPESVFSAMDRVAARCIGGAHPNWAETHAGARINAALGRTNFAADMIQVEHSETRGLNMNWRGSVTLRIENPTAIPASEGGSGTGTMTASGGGSSGNATGVSSSSTDTAGISAEGGAGGHEGSASGKVGGSASTSSTTGSSTTVTDTGNSGTSVATTDRLQRFRATIVANINLRAEPDFSGSDYVNPFKWGFAGVTGAASAMDATSASDTATCGTVTYQVSNGIAPPAR